MTTEFYKDGINFLYQVFIYDKDAEYGYSDKCSGCYGDNADFKTWEIALEEGLIHALNLI